MLLAFLGTIFALSGPKGGGLEPLLLLDRSASAARFAETPPNGFRGEVRELGSPTDVVTHREIFAALQQVQAGRSVTVWTDLSAPQGLPPEIQWQGFQGERVRETQPILLDARPINETEWILFEAFADGRLLSRRATTAAPNGYTTYRLSLGTTVHRDWVAAFQAVRPDMEILLIQEGEDAPAATGILQIQRDGQLLTQPSAWQTWDWSQPPTPEQISVLARIWRSWADPRQDSREAFLDLEAPPYPQTLAVRGQIQEGHAPSWRTLVVLLSGLCATAAWWGLPRSTHSPSAV